MLQALLAVAVVVVAAVLGALINRFRGGWPSGVRPKKGWRFLTLSVAALPYAAAELAGRIAAGAGVVEMAAWASGVMVLTAIMISEGHGEQMDGGRSDEATERPSKIDYAVAALYWALRKKADYGDRTFELIGLGLTGVIIHLPLAGALSWHGHWVMGPLFLAAGALKAPAYELSHQKLGGLPLKLSTGPDARGRNVETGEAVWGAVTYGAVALVAVALAG